MIIELLLLAGGGIYAAGHGLLGAVAKAKVTSAEAEAKAEVVKLKADVSAEIKKLETEVPTEVKALFAKIKSLV